MLPSKEFGSYRIIRKLARGMTDVYLAYDTTANREAVLKIVEESPDPMTQLILEAERRGAAIQKQLHDADSRVIEVYESGDLDSCFFVAMQYIEGRTIAEILKEEKRLEPERAARFAIEILNQLDRLHSFQAEIDGEKRSIVHGDIKPSNVQIGANDAVRLLDFGIAKVLTFTHSRTHLDLGSPGYCSPERLSRGQVDRHADLWAVAATLYEMLAGSPPYQARDTRKLEELIQSKRPPRALPAGCPLPLQVILNKALAGDLHQRYVSAASFESDLRLYLQNRPPLAEIERRRSWSTNPTVEKQRSRILQAIPQSVSSMADTVRQSVMKLRPQRSKQVATALSIVVALCWGVLAGLIVCVPAAYAYRFWRQSEPLRHPDFAPLDAATIDANWNLFQQLHRKNQFLGDYSPAVKLGPAIHADLLRAADEVIDRYRNSSDATLEHFDWQKATVCLRHAIEMDPDRRARGKLALCEGYLALQRAIPEESASSENARAKFQEAASLLLTADPHLALARLYIYQQKNAGKAVAELREAQHLGFKPGAREMEEEGDGYRFRANAELKEAQSYRGKSCATEARYLRLAQRDYERARQLYEPIAGFSNVSAALSEVDDDDRSREKLSAIAMKRPKPAKRSRHVAARRYQRWQ